MRMTQDSGSGGDADDDGDGDGDRGSTLLLVPAGFLVVLILASIAIDMSLVHLRQRQAVDVASGAANDVVTAVADESRLRSGAGLGLDQSAAEAAVDRIVAASDLAPHVVGSPVVRVTADSVEVELTVAADYIFAGAVPGAPDGTTVTARASASANAS
jgi:hypothetical protein